jgi:hypothetical protein
MKFRDFEGPFHIDASPTRLAYWAVTAYSDALNDRVVVGEFPYESNASDAAVRKEVARVMAGRCATYDVPLRPRAWVKEGDDGQHEVSFTSKVPAGWEGCSYPLHASRDNCELCFGTKGGVLGNENVIKGQVVCDYCHAAM